MSGDEAEVVVAVNGLGKRRGTTQALDDVTFEIRRGRVFGLIGCNGAGKTTTISVLLGMLRPDAGTVTVFGHAPMLLPRDQRRRIGCLGESLASGLPDLPIPALLDWQSCLFEGWDWQYCEELMKSVAVPRDRRLSELSVGDRRKCELVLAMAHRPDLLVLDDPALGLDAKVRRDILWATLASARDRGTTVLFTSHILQDVERIVDDLLILDGGRVRARGELDEVMSRVKRVVFEAAAAPASLPGEVDRATRGRNVVVVTEAWSEELASRFGDAARVEDLALEEAFCALVGRPAEAAEESA